jgi:hypothetical protein
MMHPSDTAPGSQPSTCWSQVCPSILVLHTRSNSSGRSCKAMQHVAAESQEVHVDYAACACILQH